MSLRRLRLGEIVALGGAVCVIVALFVPWYDTPSGHLSAWQTFGVGVALLILCAVMGILLALATVTERSTAIPMATIVWTVVVGIAGVIAALVRVLERPGHATGVAIGGWLALAGALAVLVGSWQAMRDERTTAYEPLDIERRPPPVGSQ